MSAEWLHHNCPLEAKVRLQEKLRTFNEGYGYAVTEIICDLTTNKEWCMSNGEYLSPCFYCPWCGEKLDGSEEKVQETSGIPSE